MNQNKCSQAATLCSSVLRAPAMPDLTDKSQYNLVECPA